MINLKPFKRDVLKLIESIKFQNTKRTAFKTLCQTIKKLIHTTKKLVSWT